MKYIRYIILILILAIIVGIGRWGASLASEYNNKDNSIIGKWISQETGKIVEFSHDGIVEVNGVEMGKYIISSPGMMEYSLEGHTFETNYKVDGRSLVWGLIGEEEKFDRKGF